MYEEESLYSEKISWFFFLEFSCYEILITFTSDSEARDGLHGGAREISFLWSGMKH